MAQSVFIQVAGDRKYGNHALAKTKDHVIAAETEAIPGAVIRISMAVDMEFHKSWRDNGRLSRR